MSVRSWRPVLRRTGSVLGSALRIGLVAGVIATVSLPAAAQAATVSVGTLRLWPARATAGDAASAFAFLYTAPGSPTAGTLTINVPAGFSPPQVATPRAAGYLTTLSTCSRFAVSSVTAEPDLSHTIAIAVNCAKQRSGILTYSRVTVPTAARTYPLSAAYTLSGSRSPIEFTDRPAITVKPGALASLMISPAAATVAPGGNQAYTAQGADAFGNTLGDVTSATSFTITPDGSCTQNICTATQAGAHTVTGTDNRATATAALKVAGAAADLAITEAVDQASPAYDTNVEFTTTVTNLSTTTESDGVTAAVTIPAGLTSVSADSAGYDVSTGVWTIGTLAPGGSATLHISGLAAAVAFGPQSVNATVSSLTADSNPGNNTASAAEASVPAPIEVIITPAPSNPANIDIGQPGVVSWTASEVNADNPTAPVPAGSVQWSCSTGSGNACPPAQGTDVFNIPTLTYVIQRLQVDFYTLTATFTPTDPNYQTTDVSNTIQFATTNSGAS